MFERNGRIYCFPLLLRIDANQSAVRSDAKIERKIRPSELVRLLAKAQKRPQRFREQAFLDWSGAPIGGSSGASGTGPTRAEWLRWSIFTTRSRCCRAPTIRPRNSPATCCCWTASPDLRTRSGERFEFPHGTTTKGIKPLIVYDEKGTERVYYGIRFVPGG